MLHPGVQITVSHQILVDQNLLMSDQGLDVKNQLKY